MEKKQVIIIKGPQFANRDQKIDAYKQHVTNIIEFKGTGSKRAEWQLKQKEKSFRRLARKVANFLEGEPIQAADMNDAVSEILKKLTFKKTCAEDVMEVLKTLEFAKIIEILKK